MVINNKKKPHPDFVWMYTCSDCGKEYYMDRYAVVIGDEDKVRKRILKGNKKGLGCHSTPRMRTVKSPHTRGSIPRSVIRKAVRKVIAQRVK